MKVPLDPEMLKSELEGQDTKSQSPSVASLKSLLLEKWASTPEPERFVQETVGSVSALSTRSGVITTEPSAGEESSTAAPVAGWLLLCVTVIVGRLAVVGCSLLCRT